jgi:hypothetical protein
LRRVTNRNAKSTIQKTMKIAPKVRTSEEMASLAGANPVEREDGEDEWLWKEEDTVCS